MENASKPCEAVIFQLKMFIVGKSSSLKWLHTDLFHKEGVMQNAYLV